MAARRFDLWSAPFDGAATLGWPGARYAPAKVRDALAWMTMRAENGEIFAIDTDQTLPFGPDTIADRGDVGVIAHDLDRTLGACSEAVTASVRAGRVPMIVGGDDSLLFGAVRGLHDAVAGTVGVIHFDAHLDLMDSNVQQGRFSHSSGMRRASELDRVDPGCSVQVGARHFNFPSSRAYQRKVGLEYIGAVEFTDIGHHRVVERVLARTGAADHRFLAFDIDVIDPAHAPGAGAHEPGGLTSRQALDTVRLLSPHCDGVILTEVNPLRDVHDRTANLAAYLLFTFAVFGSASR